MLTFSQEQLFERWDHLPMTLREAMYAPEISDTLWKICADDHLSEEKIHTVAKIVGFVFMGLLAPDQISKEIVDAIGIDIRIATSIASAINQRIFTPIRPDIDKVYNPSTSGTTTPKIFEEVRPPMAELIPRSAPAPLPSISSVAPVSATATPAPLPKQEPIKPATEKTVSSLDEFARFKTGAAPSAPPAPAPKPIVLQTESMSRPIPNAPDFKVPTIAENIMGGRKGSEPLPTKTAVIEFGGMPVPKALVAQSSAAPKVTVVRYGSEKSAPPMMPPKPEASRTVTEITQGMFKMAAPMPQAPLSPSFTPLSQIPVPSPMMPKPQVPKAPAAPMPPVPQKPTP